MDFFVSGWILKVTFLYCHLTNTLSLERLNACMPVVPRLVSGLTVKLGASSILMFSNICISHTSELLLILCMICEFNLCSAVWVCTHSLVFGFTWSIIPEVTNHCNELTMLAAPLHFTDSWRNHSWCSIQGILWPTLFSFSFLTLIQKSHGMRNPFWETCHGNLKCRKLSN